MSFCWPTEEGRVSGSKSALRMRASFADRDVLGRVTAMVVLGLVVEYMAFLKQWSGYVGTEISLKVVEEGWHMDSAR